MEPLHPGILREGEKRSKRTGESAESLRSEEKTQQLKELHKLLETRAELEALRADMFIGQMVTSDTLQPLAEMAFTIDAQILQELESLDREGILENILPKDLCITRADLIASLGNNEHKNHTIDRISQWLDHIYAQHIHHRGHRYLWGGMAYTDRSATRVQEHYIDLRRLLS